MPKRTDPFEARPDLAPVFFNKVDKKTGSRRFIGFKFLGGMIETGPNAEKLTDLQLRCLARVALGQNFKRISQRLHASPWFIGSQVNKTMEVLGVNWQHHLLPAALRDNILDVAEFADPDFVVTTDLSLKTIRKMANFGTLDQIGAEEGVDERAIFSRLERAGRDLGFMGPEVLVTAALMAEPKTLELIKSA